ncbi:MAG TPA: methylated-DNA--[protein]-cysteine S-methyltransferase [Thermoanaerobaculia bacterium]|nr:methylated-DNA--[protein]-cysteine S-methyltransferase [Thermoanaerobaculia bacterium]HUM29807.1 methylated-DNA--[protein]-cysteine S-methyltransferase [Thermoanaerobaculia bacterium]HXK68082.1 methylated-DNA--[protein]-cysteine S-methyltransferase [Thermoanaerobaculia bacterium]
MDRNTLITVHLETPIGFLRLAGSPDAILYLDFTNEEPEKTNQKMTGALAEASSQLRAYFRGTLTVFDLPLQIEGTLFQKAVWEDMVSIPYGSVRSYGELAQRIGRPKAMRAVGQASHRNPISIIVPCHRVVGANGSLTGYGGGLWRKEWLLNHERRFEGKQ